MRGSSVRKRLILAGAVAAILLIVPTAFWLSLTHRPSFYRDLVEVSKQKREGKARHFVASSLQLRNDISNERDWQAVFSDQEVNAWLAEDLVTSFADLIPPTIHEPRVAFEADRVTLAFEFDQGPIRSVIWIVARVRVPEDNVLALTVEKVRAGVMPISIDRFIAPLTEQAADHGIDLKWTKEDGMPVAQIRYKADHGRADVVLQRLAIRKGQIRLSGQSDRQHGGIAKPTLPSGRVIQLNFPSKRKRQSRGTSSSLRSSTRPTS